MKNIFIMIFILLSVLFLSSCSKNSPANFEDGEYIVYSLWGEGFGGFDSIDFTLTFKHLGNNKYTFIMEGGRLHDTRTLDKYLTDVYNKDYKVHLSAFPIWFSPSLLNKEGSDLGNDWVVKKFDNIDGIEVAVVNGKYEDIDNIVGYYSLEEGIIVKGVAHAPRGDIFIELTDRGIK